MATQIEIQSTNYNGQLAEITFYPCSGGSINLGYQTIPYVYTNDNYEGTYDLYFSAYNKTCQLVITCLTPTITSTPTSTPSVTLTPTPTGTPIIPTPTPTPTGGGLDPDATTYINAVIADGGTLSTPQRAAINTFFVGLKTDGIYNKFYYLHLFFGGTAGSNAINAKTPGTYNLSFQGTWTHSVTGSTTTQNDLNYAESGFVVSSSSPSTTETDFSFGYMMSDRNLPVTAYQYQGIGTSTSNYMIIGQDWIQVDGITNFWSTLEGNNLLPAGGKTGVWNSVSRSGSTAWYVAALFNGGDISTGLTKSSVLTSTFTPSATPYDINLFRVNGLNSYNIGGNALLNYASTYLSPTEIDSFAQRANTLQLSFNRNIYPVYNTAGVVTSINCGDGNISGGTFSITFNGNTYPLNTIYSANTLSNLIPISYPSPGTIYDFQFNLDSGYELCNSGLGSGKYNRMKVTVGPSVGSVIWSSTTQFYSGTTLVYQDTNDQVTLQGSPYNAFGQTYTVNISTNYGALAGFLVHPTFDTDAQNYINAVIAAGGTLNGTQEAAINTLFTDLKGAGLYSKIPYFYPMVGGTSASNAIMGNRTFGTTYDLTYNGTLTHSISGITKTSSDNADWCDTHIVPSTNLSLTSYHISSYQNVYGGECCGYHGAGPGPYTALRQPYRQVLFGGAAIDGGYGVDGGIFSIGSRTASNVTKGFDRTATTPFTQYGTTNTNPQNSLSSNSIGIFIINPNGFGGNGTLAFFTVGEGLSDSECVNLDTIIETFQTTLGRNF